MGNGGSARGCGDSREAGGVYMEVGGIGGAIPMYEIIKDPVEPIDPKAVGLSPVGVKLIEIDGVTHVFDWVGAKHYPNASDFIEEAVRLGISRRISKKEDLSKLTAESRLVLVHPKAFITGGESFFADVPCPTGKHPGDRSTCAGRLWLVGDPGSTDITLAEDYVGPRDPFPDWAPIKATPSPGNSLRIGRRSMPSFTYTLGQRPHDVGITLGPGIIMVAPIERLAVINDPNDSDATRDALERAYGAKLPVKLEDL